METLPTWDQVNSAYKARSAELGFLELLILENEPANVGLSHDFRCQLLGAINDAEVRGARKAQREAEELKSYLRTLANFGGTLQQSRDLARKALEK